ncbi:MAG: MEKHLA domain-containing protein [Luteolibacter sp.]
MSEPSEKNAFMADHVELLLHSHHELTGKHLIAAGEKLELAQTAYEAPFVLLSHGTEDDPILNYGNLAAQRLFAMPWEKLTGTPSRFTAELPNREERQRLLKRVTENGYIDDYSGIRIAADGRRFLIRNATVWNVTDTSGRKIGQAAAFSEWDELHGA